MQEYTPQEAADFMRSRNARNTVGKALGRAYPTHPWFVDASEDGTTVRVMCPAISTEYGMVIHVHQINHELEAKAVRMGGELLERFNVSRVEADFTGVDRKINGQARLASQGGV